MLRSGYFSFSSSASRSTYLLAASILWFWGADVNAQVTTSISSGMAPPSGSVSLNIATASTGSYQAAALQWTMSYSSADIASVSVIVGANANGASKSVSCAPATGGTVCVLYGMNQNSVSDGTVAVATFQLAPGATDSNIPVQITDTNASDADGNAIVNIGSGGSITLIPTLPQVGLSCSTTSTATPATITCSASLSTPAPSGGFTANLQSDNPALTVPSTITIPGGASSQTFNAIATAVTTGQTATVTVIGGSNTPSFSVSLLPSTVQIQSISCSPTSISASGNAICSATLNGAAPATGLLIQLSSNNPFLVVPATLLVPAGSASATFQVRATGVTSNQTAILTASVGSASASTSLSLTGTSSPGISTSIWYKIVNRNSGKVLDVAGLSTADGGFVQQWDWWGGDNQKWRFTDVGNGYYAIVNKNSNKVLDVSGVSIVNGAPTYQWTWWTGPNQQWQPVNTQDGYYTFINKNSGKVLDMAGLSTANGGALQQWDPWNGPNQQWQLVPVQ